jgi:uncharacterized membrane-anchored protein YitT (DUF2179 family)
MFTHSDSVHLRYVLVLNALAALPPASLVKGRANDPLLHASWYTLEQHSAVLLVSAAAILGTGLVYFLLKRNFRRWWIFLLAGSATAMFPGLFYLVFAPHNDQILAATTAMIVVGLVWGALMGLAIYAIFRKSRQEPAPNPRLERP